MAGSGAIAVLSDIHSNLHALEAVFTECTLRGIERFFCLGDVVGYGAFPGECLQAIRRLKCPTVLGNHDECVAKGEASLDLNYMARAGIFHSIRCLGKADREWLAALPAVATEANATLVHASLIKPLEWDYVTEEWEADLTFPMQRTPVCFYGHTHLPRLFTEPRAPKSKEIAKNKFQLSENGRYLINPGSVGQPRGGGDPRSQFLVYTPADLTVEFVRVEYNIDAAADAILKAELPSMLANRLYHGL